jgi:flagellar hook-length control protein FliK
MNATGLPISTGPSVAVPAAAEPAAAPTTAGAEESTDFVLALAQMLGASVPASGAQSQLASTANTDDADAGEAEAALALLPLPIAPLQTQPQLLPVEGDPLEMLGLTAPPEGPSARDIALLQALTERLAAADESPKEPQVPNGALSSLDAMQPRTTPADAAAQARSLQHPVGTPAWTDELGARLTMMTENGQHTASLRLSPEHLGPLEIRIAMRDDQASVWFGAAHADTRAAIEHALPRLRELFAAQGMSLADAGVFREPPRQQLADWPGRAGASDNEPAMSTEPTSVITHVQIGLLDAYA